jgi:NAD-dependent SIR2 family protein deacetylase
MKVRCNQCMEMFEEEEIIISNDEDYYYKEEVCPKCKKGGCLLDLGEED